MDEISAQRSHEFTMCGVRASLGLLLTLSGPVLGAVLLLCRGCFAAVYLQYGEGGLSIREYICERSIWCAITGKVRGCIIDSRVSRFLRK